MTWKHLAFVCFQVLENLVLLKWIALSLEWRLSFIFLLKNHPMSELLYFPTRVRVINCWWLLSAPIGDFSALHLAIELCPKAAESPLERLVGISETRWVVSRTSDPFKPEEGDIGRRAVLRKLSWKGRDLGLEDRALQAKRTASVKLQDLEYTWDIWELVGYLTRCKSSGWKLQSKLQHIKHFLQTKLCRAFHISINLIL